MIKVKEEHEEHIRYLLNNFTKEQLAVLYLQASYDRIWLQKYIDSLTETIHDLKQNGAEK